MLPEICIVLGLTLITLTLIFANQTLKEKKQTYREELSLDEKEILIGYTYENYAWGYQGKELIVFNDGTIYTWETDITIDNNASKKSTCSIDDYDELYCLKKRVIEEGTKINVKLSEQDLKTIEEQIKGLEDKIELNHLGADQGTYTLSVWKDKKRIDLKVDGDATGENKTQNAQKIIKIFNKKVENINY